MRDQNINTFQKGMMTDLGETLPQDGNYIYGENIRIVSNGPDSGETGVVVNVEGNKEYCPLVRSVFILVDDNPSGPDDTPIIDPEEEEGRVFKMEISTENVKVIGSTFIRNKIVLFGVSNCLAGENCIGNHMYGIYVIDQDQTPLQLDAIYEGEDLNFDQTQTIEAIGRYENELTERVYFTDNVNPVRLINILDPAPNASQLNLIPSIDFPALNVKRVLSGGNLPAGIYQYAYRLKTKQGLETRFSTFTPPIHVVDSGNYYWKHEEDPEDRLEINGNPPGTRTNKSVELSVKDVDQSYDYIEFAAIHRTTKLGVQDGNVYIFDQREILSDTTIVTHTSNSSLQTISLQEALAFSFTVDTAKTMATKDNKLFLGNLTEKQVDLQLNTRAYRWRRYDKVHYPYKPTDFVVTYSNNWNNTEISSEDDINPFNDLDGNDIKSDKKFKYKSDGVTLGGEGPYISYTFTKKIIEGDTLAGASPGSPPFVASNTTDAQCSREEGYASEDSLLDYKAGQTNMFKGYQRDETYRFGIVFYDLKGNPGHVNWIADIRFPAVDDVDITRFYNESGYLQLPFASIPFNPLGNSDNDSPMNYSLSQTQISQGCNYYMSIGNDSHKDLTVEEGSDMQIAYLHNSGGTYTHSGVNSNYEENQGTNQVNQGKHYLYALGIKFDVNLPDEFKEKISGYKIVRVPRAEEDKTVLGVGLINYFHKFYDIVGGAVSRMVLGYNRNLYYKFGFGEPNLYFGNNALNTLLSFDSPEFPFTQNYPTANDCTYFEYYGSLADGRERNAYRDSFEGTDYINYRKYLAHIVENVKPRHLSGQAEAWTPGEIGWEGVQGYTDVPRRFNILSMYKLDQGATQKANLYTGTDFSTEFGVTTQLEPAAELYNYSLETEFNSIVGGGFFNYGGISTGEETLFIQLPQGYVQDSNLAPFSPDYATSGLVSEINPPNIGLHFTNWMPRYTTDGLSFSDYVASEYQEVDHWPSSYPGTNMQSVIKYEKLLGVLRKDLGSGAQSTQYRGTTEQMRQTNTYIAAGNFELKDTKETAVFGGDTYVTFYDLEKVRMFSAAGDNPELGDHNDSEYGGDVPVRGYSFIFPVETTVNTTLRTGYHMANKQNFTLNDNTTMLNQFLYENTYSAEDDLQKYYSKNDKRFIPEQFDFRIAYSDTKDDSELIDSWRNFKVLNYKDLEGSQGPINKLATIGEQMIFLQDRGVGMLKINPLSTTLDQTGTSIVLGKGETIADFQYLSRATGLKNTYCAITTGNSIYWIDESEKNLYKIGGKGLVNLSDSLKINSLIENELKSPHYYNIRLGYDHINNEVLFNLNSDKTLVFNELTNSFTSVYTMGSELFIEGSNGLFSLGMREGGHASISFLFSHNSSGYKWYRDSYNSSIEFIVNKNPILPKVFDNLEWYAIGGLPEEDLFEHAVFNNSHETASVKFETNFPYKKVKEKMAKTPIPRNQNNGRFRDTYLKIKLITENTKKVALHYVKTLFRISRR